jgi:magnesium transporter
LEDGDFRSIRQLLKDLHPADIAFVIEHLSGEYADTLFSILDDETASSVLSELNEPRQQILVKKLQKDKLSDLVEEMESDDAADIVSLLKKDEQEQVLESMDEEEDAEEIRELLQHPEDTAGGRMSKEVVTVKDTSGVASAVEEIRKAADETEQIYNVFVVSEDENRLLGILPLNTLLLAKSDIKVSEIMEKDVVHVTTRMDQEEVAKLVKKYDMVEIPVVDEGGRLVGRITHDDIMDVIEEEAHEDISHMAGAGEEEITEPSAFKVSRVRLPWLVIGLFGGLVSAVVMSRFEVAIERIVTLVFFVPVVMAMGGNVGMQSSAIVVRGLATGEIDVTHTLHRLFREIRVALINGLVCGAILTALTFFWLKNIHLGAVVGGALICVILISTFVGTLVPLLLKRFDIDPALATGPFVTTSNDIIGLAIYFTFTTVLLNLIS